MRHTQSQPAAGKQHINSNNKSRPKHIRQGERLRLRFGPLRRPKHRPQAAVGRPKPPRPVNARPPAAWHVHQRLGKSMSDCSQFSKCCKHKQAFTGLVLQPRQVCFALPAEFRGRLAALGSIEIAFYSILQHIYVILIYF